MPISNLSGLLQEGLTKLALSMGISPAVVRKTKEPYYQVPLPTDKWAGFTLPGSGTVLVNSNATNPEQPDFLRTLAHEMVHKNLGVGFGVRKLAKSLPLAPSERSTMESTLQNAGYGPELINPEIPAYLADGSSGLFGITPERNNTLYQSMSRMVNPETAKRLAIYREMALRPNK